MKLDICKYTPVKICDELGINKRIEFLFSEVCGLKLNQSSYILPIASDDTLGGIKVGDGLNIDSQGVLSVVSGVLSKFGIDDNLGIQNRQMNMEGFNFEVFSSDIDSYANWFLDDESISMTSSDGTYQGAFDILPLGVRVFSGEGTNTKEFHVKNDGIYSIQNDGIFNYITSFPYSNGTLVSSINNLNADLYGRVYLPLQVPNNGIISGGILMWESDYNYTLSQTSYVLNGSNFTIQQSPISLSPSDPTNDRIDLIVLNNLGQVEIIEGTPSMTPAVPSYDYSSQLYYSVVLVTAGSTSPFINNENVYLENTEWTVDVSDPRINPDFVSSPIIGTKSISFSNVINGDLLSFRRSSVSLSSYNSLSFKIKLLSPLSSDKKINLSFFRNSTLVSNIITISNGIYGFNSSDLGTQTIALPLSIFNISGNITKLNFQIIASSGSLDFIIDNVIIQEAIINVSNNYQIPSLEEVTNVGNVSSNLIWANGYVNESDTFTIYNHNPNPVIRFNGFNNILSTFSFLNISSERNWIMPDADGTFALEGQISLNDVTFVDNNSSQSIIAPSFSTGNDSFLISTNDGITAPLLYIYGMSSTNSFNIDLSLFTVPPTVQFPDADGIVALIETISLFDVTQNNNRTSYDIIIDNGSELAIMKNNGGSDGYFVALDQLASSSGFLYYDGVSVLKGDSSGYKIISQAQPSEFAEVKVLGHNGIMHVSNEQELDLSVESGQITKPICYIISLSTGTQVSDLEFPDPSDFSGCEIVIINSETVTSINISGSFIPVSAGTLTSISSILAGQMHIFKSIAGRWRGIKG